MGGFMYQCDLYGTNISQKVPFMTHYYNLDTTRVYNLDRFYTESINLELICNK